MSDLDELIKAYRDAGGDNASRHVDCIEIVKDNAKAKAKAILIVNGTNQHVKVTGAIGSVDRGRWRLSWRMV